MQITGSSGSTYVDYVTAASSTNPTPYSYYTIPQTSLAAKNTAVTTTTASTLTIAGPPNQGTNNTISNAYALYVSNGASYFTGSVLQPALFYYKAYGGNNGVNASANTNYAPTLTSIYNNLPTGALTISNGQYIFNCPSTGTWAFTLNGYSTAGVLLYNIYIATFSNGQSGANNANNIIYDTGSTAASNKTSAGSSRLLKGDIVYIALQSTAACTFYVYNLGIYQRQATTSTLTGNSIFTIPANGNYRMDVQFSITNGSTAGVMGCWVQLTGPASGTYSTTNRLGRIDWYQTGGMFANTISFNANGLQAGWTLQPAIFNFTSGDVTVGVTDMRIVRC